VALSPFNDVSAAGEGAAESGVVAEGVVVGPGAPVLVVEGVIVGPRVVPPDSESDGVIVEGAVTGLGAFEDALAKLEGGVPEEVVEGVVMGPGVVPPDSESGVVVEGAVAGLGAFEDALAKLEGEVVAESGVVERGGEGLGGAMLLLKRAVGLIFTVPLEEKNFQRSH
jgi:hypothetical protein